MKHKLLTAVVFLLSVSTVNAQGVLEAYKYSQKDLKGTARFMSLGGAMGARGGDVSAISINPAGIGMYKSYEVVTTLDFENAGVKSEFMKENIGTIKSDRFKVSFNNLAFVATLPMYNDVVPLLNFGVSYNKTANFNKKYNMVGSNLSRPLTDYMAERATWGGQSTNQLLLPDSPQSDRDDIWRYKDWLPVLGYNGSLIDYSKDKNEYIPFDGLRKEGLPAKNSLFVEEKGSINTYDFNMGTTFSNIISAGLTLSVTDIDYKMSSLYKEDFLGDNDNWSGYDLINDFKTEGTGWKLALGLIFKPIEELRIGIAYHSPTWYDMTDYSYAFLKDDLYDLSINTSGLLLNEYPEGGGEVESMDGLWSRYEYQLRTPDRWIFSLSGAIGKIANVSVDYELTDYTKSKFGDSYGWIEDDLTSEDIKNFYRLTSTLRAGVELSFTPKFFGRLGYSWQQNPYSNEFRNFLSPTNRDNFDTPGSTAHYVIDEDAHYFTWGLGYRITRNIYTDIGFVYKTQKADLYTHSKSDVTKLDQDTFQGALTLGFRF